MASNISAAPDNNSPMMAFSESESLAITTPDPARTQHSTVAISNPVIMPLWLLPDYNTPQRHKECSAVHKIGSSWNRENADMDSANNAIEY
ncbi:MAG: hypothetical protein GY807_06320 [Gammaproteobacteria bacterium]|nr:hypothetical protein [Gammaproteobacteria bacterium]